MTVLLRRSLLTLTVLAAGLFPMGALAQHGDEAEHEIAEHGVAGHGDEPGDAAAHAGHDEGHDGDHGAVHEPVWNWFVLGGQVTNFLIWFALIVFVVRSRVPGYLAGRKAALVEGLEEARRMKDEAERKVEEYTARIDNLDSELAQMRAEMKKGGLAERDRIVKDAALRADKMRAEAKFLVEQQMKTLREELTREAIEAAIGAAEKILREKAGAADQAELAKDYLVQLEKQLARQPKEAR